MKASFGLLKISICIAAALSLWTSGIQAQNVLLNPGFDLDTPPALSLWSVNASGGSVVTTTAYAQSGANSLMIDSTGAGQWSSPNVYQTFPASPGQEWTLSGYMLTTALLPANPASFGLYKIVFRDAANVDLLPASASIGQINMAFPGVESLPFLDNNSTLNTWNFSQARGVAPAGTTQVLFYALNVNGSVSTMYFDSISAIMTVPEPSSLALAGLGLAALALFRRRS